MDPEPTSVDCETRKSPRNEQEKLDDILRALSDCEWTLGQFLHHLFNDFSQTKAYKVGRITDKRTKKHAGFVSKFLSKAPPTQHPEWGVRGVVSSMYYHPDGIPVRHRATANRPALPDADPTPMARRQLLLLARDIVLRELKSEVATLASSQTGELRYTVARQDWEEVVNFSLAELQEVAQTKAPTLYHLLSCSATSPAYAKAHSDAASTTQTAEEESGKQRNPHTIATVTTMMLAATRNLQANYLQKTLGLYLFSSTAPVQIYAATCRLGLTVGYSTVTELLQKLTKASIRSTKELAATRRFLLITDNIDRYRRFWNPRLGQQNLMMSGAASTLVELHRFDARAFNPDPVANARRNQQRLDLTAEMLWSQIDQEHTNSVLALHCLDILISSCPALSELKGYVTTELRSTYAIHRMTDGHKTEVHPLSTTSINEGSAGGCGRNLEDLLLHQLGMPPELVNKALIIIGGDLGFIEKLRALILLESSCKHGFSSFGWVLPVVQLWHMGWADLARLISSYWGIPNTSDPSTFWHNAALLNSKVKPVDRPDYYPAQRLVFDTLEADVIDCWRLMIGTHDLNTYFNGLRDPPTAVDLFNASKRLVNQWASTRAHTAAMTSGKYWDGPKSTPNDLESNHFTQESDGERFLGDACLATSILRLRNSLLHREYIWSVADGDIGRTMQIMWSWLFSFAGSSKSKYTNELLELACGFLFEFPERLQTALKNNWLCNFSGLQGCWMPFDLMQEHHNRDLKQKVQRRDEDFEGTFFQTVVSRNIRYFMRTRSAVNKSLGLHPTSSHGSRKNSATLDHLLSSLANERVHSFVEGRTYGYAARDDLAQGRRLMPAKVAAFLHRTARPGHVGSAPLDVDDDVGDGEPQDTSFEPPRPAMLIDGQLVTGDEQDMD
ncbi:hypothetical protein FRC08_015873 [Ceratobasidium sp. 394]|nr:hypothetical protein FRC08_015873 [Ceratobasidium sp. 394]KAG9089326.1 hypothetical protein FS749_001431 [Ceratobasidium sp. UAMH 11750]